MNEIEKKVWDLVHGWCAHQYHYIPDMNRRYLMDRIIELVADNKQKLNIAPIVRPEPDCPHCKGSGAVQIGYMEYSTCPCVEGSGEPLATEARDTVAEGWVATPKPKVPLEERNEKLRKKLNARKSSEGQP
jgi:RecJ-like exonuclease